MAKIKLFRIILSGTGIQETLIVKTHEILSYPASTYHKFTYMNGTICLKNDFGVSSLTIWPIELTQEEINAEMGATSH